MGVKDRLACGLSTIHADVEALRVELLLKEILNVPDEVESVRVFVIRHFPNRCELSLRNNKSMAVRNWETVQD